MTQLDYILIGILLLSTLYGFALGLICAVGSIIGVFLGAYFAGQYFTALGGWLAQYVHNSGLANVLGFILIFVLISKVTSIIFKIIDKIFHVIAFIPFLKTINRLLGAILGAIEGLLAIGIILYIISRYPISANITAQLVDSSFVPWFIKIAQVVAPLLPDLVNKLQTII